MRDLGTFIWIFLLDFTQPSSAGGKGDKLLLHKIPGFQCVCRSQMEHGWFHCTTLHSSDRHAKRTTTTKSRRQPVFRTLQRRKEHCATTTGSDTTAFNGMEPTPYSWVNIQTTEVLQLPVEKGAPERYRSAPKSYWSGCQRAIEAGSTERILEVKLFGREEYLGWNISRDASTNV